MINQTSNPYPNKPIDQKANACPTMTMTTATYMGLRT